MGALRLSVSFLVLMLLARRWLLAAARTTTPTPTITTTSTLSLRTHSLHCHSQLATSILSFNPQQQHRHNTFALAHDPRHQLQHRSLSSSAAHTPIWANVSSHEDALKALESIWELSRKVDNLQGLAMDGSMDWTLNLLATAPHAHDIALRCIGILDNFAESSSKKDPQENTDSEHTASDNDNDNNDNNNNDDNTIAFDFDVALVQKGAIQHVCKAAAIHISAAAPTTATPSSSSSLSTTADVSEDFALVTSHLLSLLIAAYSTEQVSLQEWLDIEGLGHVHSLLEDAGVTTTTELCLLTGSDLENLSNNLSPHVAQRLQTAIERVALEMQSVGQKEDPIRDAVRVLVQILYAHPTHADIVYCVMSALTAAIDHEGSRTELLERHISGLFNTLLTHVTEKTLQFFGCAALGKLAQLNPEEFALSEPVDKITAVLKQGVQAESEDSHAGLVCALAQLIQVLLASPEHSERFWLVGGVDVMTRVLIRVAPHHLQQCSPIELDALCSMLWNMSSHPESARALLNPQILSKLVDIVESFPNSPELHEAILETFENLHEVDTDHVIDHTLERTGGYAWQIAVSLQSARAQQSTTQDQQQDQQAVSDIIPAPQAIISEFRNILDALYDEEGEAQPVSVNDLQAVVAAAEWHPNDVRVLAFASEVIVAMAGGLEKELLALAIVPRLEAMAERAASEAAARSREGDSVSVWFTCSESLRKNLEVLNEALVKAAKDLEQEADQS
eukprot:c12803_g3_i4.p1 GENE.c12803_g3_i4~~c12803_g3_i4.p1  ORF type:complete len:735 (+),score=200.97 c12803_g3_i4:1-2205(+)